MRTHWQATNKRRVGCQKFKVSRMLDICERTKSVELRSREQLVRLSRGAPLALSSPCLTRCPDRQTPHPGPALSTTHV